MLNDTFLGLSFSQNPQMRKTETRNGPQNRSIQIHIGSRCCSSCGSAIASRTRDPASVSLTGCVWLT